MANKMENNYKVSLVNPEKVRLETDQGIVDSEERKWGMPLKDVYKHGLAFYKGNFLEYFSINRNQHTVCDCKVYSLVTLLKTAQNVNRSSIIVNLKY